MFLWNFMNLQRGVIICLQSHKRYGVFIGFHPQIILILKVRYIRQQRLSSRKLHHLLIELFEHFIIKIWLQMLLFQILNCLLQADGEKFVVWFFRKLQTLDMIDEFVKVLLYVSRPIKLYRLKHLFKAVVLFICLELVEYLLHIRFIILKQLS